jgi:hypothetical protein
MHQPLSHLPGVAEIYPWAISDWLKLNRVWELSFSEGIKVATQSTFRRKRRGKFISSFPSVSRNDSDVFDRGRTLQNGDLPIQSPDLFRIGEHQLFYGQLTFNHLNTEGSAVEHNRAEAGRC